MNENGEFFLFSVPKSESIETLGSERMSKFDGEIGQKGRKVTIFEKK